MNEAGFGAPTRHWGRALGVALAALAVAGIIIGVALSASGRSRPRADATPATSTTSALPPTTTSSAAATTVHRCTRDLSRTTAFLRTFAYAEVRTNPVVSRLLAEDRAACAAPAYARFRSAYVVPWEARVTSDGSGSGYTTTTTAPPTTSTTTPPRSTTTTTAPGGYLPPPTTPCTVDCLPGGNNGGGFN